MSDTLHWMQSAAQRARIRDNGDWYRWELGTIADDTSGLHLRVDGKDDLHVALFVPFARMKHSREDLLWIHEEQAAQMMADTRARRNAESAERFQEHMERKRQNPGMRSVLTTARPPAPRDGEGGA